SANRRALEDGIAVWTVVAPERAAGRTVDRSRRILRYNNAFRLLPPLGQTARTLGFLLLENGQTLGALAAAFLDNFVAVRAKHFAGHYESLDAGSEAIGTILPEFVQSRRDVVPFRTKLQARHLRRFIRQPLQKGIRLWHEANVRMHGVLLA